MIQCVVCEDWFHCKVRFKRKKRCLTTNLDPSRHFVTTLSVLFLWINHFVCLWQHLGCTVEEPEELQEMVCEGCMNKAPFLWTYAGHFAGNPFSWPACYKKLRKTNMSYCAYCPFKVHFLNCLCLLVPPVIGVSKSEEELDITGVEEIQKETDSEPKSSRNKELSTDAEQLKQEVRNPGYRRICQM